MSQAKVDRNREQKRNRKQILKSNRRKHVIEIVCTSLVVVAILGFVGYSGFNKYKAYKAEQVVSTKVDYSSVTNYLSTLGSEDSSADSSAE